MKKVLVSMPVHQAPDVIENTIKNFQMFLPQAAMVLHVSADSPGLLEEINKFKGKYNNVFINPKRWHTFKHDESSQVTGLSSVHASNFQYMDNISKFDVFAMDTSNDYLIRHGLYDVMNKFDCAFSNVTRCPPDQFQSPQTVRNCKLVINPIVMEKGTQEGFFMPADCFREVAKKIVEIQEKLGRPSLDGEEGYIPSLLFNMFPELYESNAGTHYIYHDPSEGESVSMTSINKVLNGYYPMMFGVKRVPRIINHPTRVYLNKMFNL